MPDREDILKPLFFETESIISETSHENHIHCTLCPNNCIIKPGKFGSCMVRGCAVKSSGRLQGIIPLAGKLSALAVDPIEKKPLYHFFPGSKILSAGFFGCSLKCPFCQNFTISTSVSFNADTVSPEDAADITLNSETIGLAYTYSEPLVHIEWVTETAKLIKKRNLKNILITNGYINPVPAEYILENIDAVNIDLKSFSSDFYKKELKGKLEPVKEFIRYAARKTHVEVTTLVIPGKNDSDTEIRSIAAFLASINKSIPFHLSCYYPVYRYTVAPTKPESVFRLAEIASEYLDYVYPGNTGSRECLTKCPECGAVLVKRSGYSVTVTGIENSRCKSCGCVSDIII